MDTGIIGPMDMGIPMDTGIIGPIDIGDIVDGDYPCHVRSQVINPAGITKALTKITNPFKQTFQGNVKPDGDSHEHVTRICCPSHARGDARNG